MKEKRKVLRWRLKDESQQEVSSNSKGRRMQMNALRTKYKFNTWEVEMTTVSRSLVATARNAGDGFAVGIQVFRSYLVQTSEHLDANYEPNLVDNIHSVADFAENE